MGSRTQFPEWKVLLKGIEFDFPLCKELKIDWKLPKNQFLIEQNWNGSFCTRMKIESKKLFSFFLFQCINQIYKMKDIFLKFVFSIQIKNWVTKL